MYNKFINVMKQGLNWFVWKLIIGYMYIFPPIKWRHTMSNASEPSRKTALKQAIIEVSNAWLQAESHNLHAKEVITLISEEYEMDKALVSKIAKMYHKQNISETKAKSDTLIDEYETIFGSDD